MSAELLRIKMDVDAVRRACEDLAWRQTKFDPASVRAQAIGPDDGAVEVVFIKKRVRKAKGAPNAG